MQNDAEIFVSAPYVVCIIPNEHAGVRPLQLVYMFLVHRPPRTRPPSVNVLCIARMTCGAIPNWTTLYCACAVAAPRSWTAS